VDTYNLIITIKYLISDIYIFISEIKALDWMTYTLHSDNETRVAEIVGIDLKEYGKAGNPISKRSINLKMIVVMLIRSFSTPPEPQSME
jgi:hypothetical protein